MITALMLRLGLVLASPKVRKALLVAGLVTVAVALPWITYRTGLSRGADRMHEVDVEHERAALAAAEAQYREQEHVHDKVVEQIRTDYAAASARAQVVDSQAVRALDAGARRVRLPVVRCSTNSTATGPTAARADDAATAELPGPVAAALYAIAADGDQAIRQLTALQAWARSAVTLCSSPKK